MNAHRSELRSWFKSGDPWIWMIGGALAISLIMVVGLMLLIGVRGFGHFWPSPILSTVVTSPSGETGAVLGVMVRSETLPAERIRESGQPIPDDQLLVTRHLVNLGNRDLTGRDFAWFLDGALGPIEHPADAIMLERREWGNFYGFARALEQGASRLEGDGLWNALQQSIQRTGELHQTIQKLEKVDIGQINRGIEALRLEQRRLELRKVSGAELAAAEADMQARQLDLDQRFTEVQVQRRALIEQSQRDVLIVATADGREVRVPVANIVMASRNNVLGLGGKLVFYGKRIHEFLTGFPREANTEGGIFPAIFGTVTMVLIMSVLVTPFGVLAAIYLREYARQGAILKLIRVSVYNLAGVPSIVFGVFGLGFFVYLLGGTIDELFYPERLPAPTFGTPGLFWASLTLALLTLPVVIVSTEEGLARIPRTIREGSLALGATKWETLWKVVVPLSAPAMMTGLILAVARAAGEVAPLMLVGVVKLAPSLPVDGQFPYVHFERKIMHLGFHIYDVGFQSPNVEAARPLVYATALTLVLLILILNLTAIAIRNRLREKYRAQGD